MHKRKQGKRKESGHKKPTPYMDNAGGALSERKRGSGSTISIRSFFNLLFSARVFGPRGCTGGCVTGSRCHVPIRLIHKKLAVPSPVRHLRRSRQPRSHSSLCNQKKMRSNTVRHSSPSLGFGLPLDMLFFESPHPLMLIRSFQTSHLQLFKTLLISRGSW